MKAENLIRYGKISAVYPAKATARVVYTDKDNMVSAELPVLQAGCSINQFYTLPAVGESVLTITLPNGEDGQGYIIGSHYHDNAPPPADDEDIVMINLADKIKIVCNRAKGELKIDCVGDVRINARNIYFNS